MRAFTSRRFNRRTACLVLKFPLSATISEGQIQEFVLTLPFSLAWQKKNLVAWLAARSDGENYGQVLSFQMPSDPQIDRSTSGETPGPTLFRANC